MGKTTKKESTAKPRVKVAAKPATKQAANAAAKPAVKKATTKVSKAAKSSESELDGSAELAVSKLKAPAKAKTAKAAEGTKAPASKRPPRKPVVEPDAREIIRASAMKAAQYALEKKAVNVRLLDLKDITTMTDFFVIATGDSDRQVKAIAENVIAEMRDTEGISSWRSEGWDGLQWVLVDFVDFVVHIFQTEARQYYNLERLWADAPSEEIKDEPVTEKATRKKKATVEIKPEPSDESHELANGVRVISDFREVGGDDR